MHLSSSATYAAAGGPSHFQRRHYGRLCMHLPLDFVFGRGLHAQVIAWLARSAGCPLSISIIGSRNISHWSETNADQVDMVMQALVQSSERWPTAELSFHADEGLLMLSRANSPRLKTIVLSGDPSEMVAMDLLSVEGLRSITLQDLVIDLGRLTQGSLSESLSQLHHLKTLAVGDTWAIRVGGSEPEVGATYLIALLRPNPDSPLVWSQLEVLEINEWVTLGCDPQSDLLAFAQRRLDACPHFRRLDVKYAGVVLPIPQTLLQAFAARGLTITTTSNSHEMKLSSREMPWTGLEEFANN
ncbi:hypothetical protein B0H13DRAFT_2661215 [Mycena leptocephala]|nr:hypothetical protein B0H13DRAFT_2661215 [Mycena leptocephala]